MIGESHWPEPSAIEGASDSGALRVAWNDERLDAMLSGLSSLRPLARTGIEPLDDLLGGGVCAGVHVVSAPPACGKSTLCLQMGDYFARYSKRRVIYVSCEMSAASLLVKSLVRLSCELDRRPLTQSEIVSLLPKVGDAGNPRVSLLLRAIDAYRGEIAPRFATCAEVASVDGLAAVLRGCGASELSPIVVVDYLQLLKADGHDQASGYEIVTDLMRSLCELAREHATAILCISSQNRTAKRGQADFTALAGSSEIEYGATTAMFLSAKEGEEDARRRPVTLTVAKNRFGATGAVDLVFHPGEARFAASQEAGEEARLW